MTIHSSYLHTALKPVEFRKVVTEAVKALRKRTKEFDAIAFRGFSGSLVAPCIALALNKKMIFVRKSGEPSHNSSAKAEGHDCERFIIVDDIISSGATIRAIKKAVKEAGIKGEPVGIYLWKGSYLSESQGLPIWGIKFT